MAKLMKWIFLSGVLVIIFLFLLFVSLVAQAQGTMPKPEGRIVSIPRNLPFREVIKSMEKQTGLTFFYQSKDIGRIGRIRTPLVNVSVDIALRRILKGRPLTWTYPDGYVKIEKAPRDSAGRVLSDGQSITSHTAFPPLVNLSGQVIDTSGNPISGATVTLNGQEKGVITNNTGHFYLENLPHHTILRISFIGLETKEYTVLAGQMNVEIILSTAINEMRGVDIVSTGYQKVAKDRSAASITVINQVKLNELAGTNVLDRLQYVTNGLATMPVSVKPGNGELLIRGRSTFSGYTKPLIIQDDFPYNGDLSNINPNDIESISILKDAAATSIWGARGGNGVIVITTKKGQYSQPVTVTLNANVTLTQKPDLFSRKVMGAADIIAVEEQLFNEGFYDARIPYPAYASLTPVIEILLRKRNGDLSATEAEAQLNELRKTDVRHELGKYLYRNAVAQQYGPTISGGTENHHWLISGGYDNNIMELNAHYRRNTMRFSNAYRIKKLEISTNFSLALSSDRSGASLSSLRPDQLPIYTRLTDENGTEQPLPTYSNYRAGFIDTLGSNMLLNWRYYLLQDYKHTVRTINIQEINAEVGLKYRITKALSFSTKYRYQSQKAENRLYQDINSYYTRDMINRFSQINYSNKTVKYIVPSGGILDLLNSNGSGYDLKGQIDLNKETPQHKVVAFAGAQISEVIRRENSSRNYGYDEEGYTNANVDYINSYPHLVTGEPEKISGTSILDKRTTRFVSTYMNGSYTFRNKYSLSFSIRRDAANNFGVKTNDKWKPLWSSGIDWLISDERFYHIPQLPYLKLRLTYGKSGNTDPDKVAYTTIRYEGQSLGSNLPYARVDNVYNPDLRYEKVNMLNLGIDFRTKNNRIYGSVEFFRKWMTDLYAESEVDPTAGLGRDRVVRNVGKMRGKGMDIELSTINIKGRIEWCSNLICNIYTDRVVHIRTKNRLDHLTIVDGTAPGLEGFPVYALFAYRSGGLDAEGDPQGYVNGQLSKDYAMILGSGTKFEDLAYVGRMIPAISGSLGNTISWKGITLIARVICKLGYYFRRESINYEDLSYFLDGHADYARRWRKPGDELFTKIPGLKFHDGNRALFNKLSSDLVVKGDHIRFQYINLGYELSRKKFRKMQFYIVLNNVGLLWKANEENIDPDYPLMDAPRSLTLGTRISF